MSDSNMIATYSWAAGLFQQDLPSSLIATSLNLLDQEGKTPLTPGLLFAPGTVSVIDYQGLDQNKKRVVTVYLLQMLNRFKIEAPNYDPGVVLGYLRDTLASGYTECSSCRDKTPSTCVKCRCCYTCHCELLLKQRQQSSQ
jgi:hypothetical protein